MKDLQERLIRRSVVTEEWFDTPGVEEFEDSLEDTDDESGSESVDEDVDEVD